MEIQNPKNPKEHAKNKQENARICKDMYNISFHSIALGSRHPKSDEMHKQCMQAQTCTICQGTENFLQVNLQVKLGFTL